jgi:hypothetical protein
LCLLAGCVWPGIDNRKQGPLDQRKFEYHDEQGNRILDYSQYNEFVSLVGHYGPYFSPPLLVHVSVSPIHDFPVQLSVSDGSSIVLTNPLPAGPGEWPYFRMDAEHVRMWWLMQLWAKERKPYF